MDESELEALLGRPLTPTENTNFDLYLDISKESLEELLCISLDSVSETRTFDVREGYSTVFTGIFTEITEVRLDGNVTTDYYPAFWDKRSSAYYNSIVLGKKRAKEVEITGFWGFGSIPADLKLLWAQLFANVSKKYSPGNDNIRRKAVEDFSLWLGDLTDDQAFINANARTIKKYSMCNIGYMLHGKTCRTHRRRNCGCL
jgi:hypothetical protein